MSDLRSSWRICFALLRRDAKVLRTRLWGIFFDNCMILAVNIFVFGYMLPRMGMAKELIGPIFIGAVFMIFLQSAFSWAGKFVADIKFNRFIDYQLGLPLTIHWLLAEYVAQFVLEVAIITLPVLLIGVLLLGSKFTIVSTSWTLFFLMYFLSLLFFATLSLLFGLVCEHDWFWSNDWTRVLDPLFLFGAIFVTWRPVYAFSHCWGILFLCNPVTYAVEGLRAALIGGDQFLSVWLCIIGVSVGIGINIFLLIPGARKALDHI